MANPVFTITVEGNKVVATAASGEKFEIVPSDLPATQKGDCLEQGVSQVLRVSYANAQNPEHAVKLLKARIDDLMSGKWRPGARSNSVAAKEPDDLARAVMEAVNIDFTVYQEQFLPNYLAANTTMKETADGKKRRVGGAAALRALASRPEIAPIIAKLAAARAKAHAKDAPEGPSLTDYASASNTFRPASAAAE
jgi:hypothetical protein